MNLRTEEWLMRDLICASCCCEFAGNPWFFFGQGPNDFSFSWGGGVVIEGHEGVYVYSPPALHGSLVKVTGVIFGLGSGVWLNVLLYFYDALASLCKACMWCSTANCRGHVGILSSFIIHGLCGSLVSCVTYLLILYIMVMTFDFWVPSYMYLHLSF